LPGYPLAAQTVLRELAMPLLEQWGLSAPSRQCIRARLAQALASDPGFDEFVPVYAARVGTILWASPNSRGAGVQMATVKSNGYVHVPAPLEGYDRGSECSVVLTTDPACIDKTVLLSGVLDPALEELAHCPSEDGLLIHATNTGTLGGFLALRMNACHAAPVSLPAFSLLPQCHFLASHLLPEKHRFVHLASMGQGIASRDGIGPEDLPGARFINTRKDTTSRMILDLLLAEKGIGTDQIDGYTHEVQGSLAVADAIRKGFADAGMCSSGIAESAGLEFVPVAREDYELVLNRSMEEDPLIQALIRRIASPGFREILARKGGYDCTGTGIVRCLSRDLSLCPVADDHIDYIPAGSC
jgi:putative molybdopterin biosynthesis protein